VKQAPAGDAPDGARPAYLLDREAPRDAKALSSALKEKRKEKAAKYAVPLPKVRGIAEDEMFKVLRTGKSKSKSWKRMVTKATFVGEGFTRKPVKLERFVRPMALRYKKANVTHRESRLRLRASFELTCYRSRPQGDVPAADPRREEEPAVADVHLARRAHKRHRH
jgi:ribosome biogenesis protein NSA2